MITKSKLDSGFSEYTIEDGCGAFVKIIPEKGGLVTNFCVNGHEVLYFNRDLFVDGNDIYAGGLPLLFPICGSLNNDAYSVKGHCYKMMDHGFARLMSWSVIQACEESNEIILELINNELTKKAYPFDFRCVVKIALSGQTLDVSLRLENRGAQLMPFYAGFHPFFHIKNKDALQFNMDIEKSYMDYANHQKDIYTGKINFTQPVDFLFHLNQSPEYSYDMIKTDEQYKISIVTSCDYEYMLLWTEVGRNFVCMEPWMGKPDAMNTGTGLRYLRQNECLDSFIKISLCEL